MSSPWVVVGCGYTGARLAAVLRARGSQVTLTRRDPAAARALADPLGARGVGVELSTPSSLAQLVPAGAIVVCLAPPGADPAAELRTLIDASAGARKLVYVSSTGVYGPGGGAWVDETWPLAPITASGAARVRAEAALDGVALPHVILRVAAIYGPGRGFIERIRAGTYRIIGDDRVHISRIHVDDLVTSIVTTGEADGSGPINVADDDPTPIGEVADAVAARLGVPSPPRVAVASVSTEVAGMLGADRRICNRRLKQLGVVLRYPSWSTALTVG